MYPNNVGPWVSLSDDEIDKIIELPLPKKGHVIIEAHVNYTWCSVIAIRGDGLMMVIPFVLLTDIPAKLEKPDYKDFSIIDGGNTLKFGKYEVAVDYLLYDLDADYRIWANNNRLN